MSSCWPVSSHHSPVTNGSSQSDRNRQNRPVTSLRQACQFLGGAFSDRTSSQWLSHRLDLDPLLMTVPMEATIQPSMFLILQHHPSSRQQRQTMTSTLHLRGQTPMGMVPAVPFLMTHLFPTLSRAKPSSLACFSLTTIMAGLAPTPALMPSKPWLQSARELLTATV